MKVIETRYVDVEAVVIDEAEYPRAEVDHGRIEDLAELLETGVEFPAVVVEDGTMRLVCGRHRFEAHRKAGLTTVLADVVDLEGERPLLVAFNDDAVSSLPMGRADRKKVAAVLVAADPEGWDVTTIAAQVGVTDRTVRRWFDKELAARQKADEERRPARILATKAMAAAGMKQAAIAEVVGVSRPQVNSDLSVSDGQMSLADTALLDPVAVAGAHRFLADAPEKVQAAAAEWLDAEVEKAAAEKAAADEAAKLRKQRQGAIDVAKKNLRAFLLSSPTIDAIKKGAYSEEEQAEILGDLSERSQSIIRHHLEVWVPCPIS